MELFTLTGISYGDVFDRLADPLPEGAFKPVPSKSYLTDINTGYMIERITEVFGLRGVGWGLDYEPEDMILVALEGRTTAHLRYAKFWYALVDGAGEISHQDIVVSALNNNDAQYAEEGARTSALGSALKQLGFQNAVYKNEKPDGSGEPAGSTGSGSNRPPKKSQPQTKKAPTPVAKKEEAPAPLQEKAPESHQEKKPEASGADSLLEKALAYKVPAGVLYAGRTFKQVLDMPDGMEALTFLAGTTTRPTDGQHFDPSTVEDGDKIQKAAQYVLKEAPSKK